MYILVDCKDWEVICADYVPISCNVCVLGTLLFSNCSIINFSTYLCTCVYIVWFTLVLHIVAIQWLDHSHSNFSQTSGRASCKWYCASYRLWFTGSQLCMHPVCHSLCFHTYMYTCSPVSSWHSMDIWYMCGLYWTLLLGQVTHDRCCQCLLVLSGGPMLQWCWLGCCQGRNC